MLDSSHREASPLAHHAATAIARFGVSLDRTRELLALSLTLTVLLSACASSGTPKKSAPHGDYLRAVKERVAAVQAKASLSLRHNPAPCDCPPHEVMLADVWHRVALDVATSDEKALADAEGFFEAHPTRRLTVTGSIGSKLRSCARGAIFLTLILDEKPSIEATD